MVNKPAKEMKSWVIKSTQKKKNKKHAKENRKKERGKVNQKDQEK